MEQVWNMREELEQDVLTTVRDRAGDATSDLLTRHPRDEVMEAIGELTRDGFVESRVDGSAVESVWIDLLGLTERGEALLHDLEHVD